MSTAGKFVTPAPAAAAAPTDPALAAARAHWEQDTRAPYVAANPEREAALRTQALRWPVDRCTPRRTWPRWASTT